MFLEGHLSFLTKPNLLDSENYSGSGCQFFKLVWGQLQFVQKKKAWFKLQNGSVSCSGSTYKQL